MQTETNYCWQRGRRVCAHIFIFFYMCLYNAVWVRRGTMKTWLSYSGCCYNLLCFLFVHVWIPDPVFPEKSFLMFMGDLFALLHCLNMLVLMVFILISDFLPCLLQHCAIILLPMKPDIVTVGSGMFFIQWVAGCALFLKSPHLRRHCLLNLYEWEVTHATCHAKKWRPDFYWKSEWMCKYSGSWGQIKVTLLKLTNSCKCDPDSDCNHLFLCFPTAGPYCNITHIHTGKKKCQLIHKYFNKFLDD